MQITKLFFLAPLLLTACVKPGPVLPPEPYVEIADLLAAVNLTPRALPALEPAALGRSGTLSGPTLPQFPVGQAVYLSSPGMTWPGVEVGRIVSRGQVELQLRELAHLPSTGQQSALAFARGFNTSTPCAVDTVKTKAGQENVQLTRVDILTRNRSVSAAALLQPLTSPIPEFVNVLPYLAINTKLSGENRGLLVYAAADVEIQGEMRCISSYVTRLEDATQFNLSVNLDLRQGWNLIRERINGVPPQGKVDIIEVLLSGSASDYSFRPAATN
ncbi:hypothetical protein [Deinococcus sp. QL22]|uniref:hypothetical protein n=1 Tax=Deinococcus sp. QL22 TaxID=2939437 RepID=UPI002017451E|nr:hypothetical protein [Deinococcus sp. QL22]UQN10563.1 hypothetical protein M1R55_30655 [Deinococcus sp. QL22]